MAYMLIDKQGERENCSVPKLLWYYFLLG